MEGILFLTAVIFALFVYAYFFGKKQEKEKIQYLREIYGKPNEHKLTHEHLIQLNNALWSSDLGEAEGIWNDLDMDRIFNKLDQSSSAIGEEYFYFTLKNILNPKADKDYQIIKSRQKLTAELKEDVNKECVDMLRIRLSSIRKHERITLYGGMNNLKKAPVDSTVFHILCLVLFFVSIAMLFVKPGIGLIMLFTVACFNSITYIRRREAIEGMADAVSSLINWLGVMNSIVDMKTEAKTLNELFHDVEDKLKSFASVRRMSWLLSPKSVVASIAEILMDYIKFLTHIDLIKFNMVIRCLKGHEQELSELYKLTGEIELGIIGAGISCFSQEFCFAEISDEEEVCIKSMTHPLLDISVENDFISEKPVLITGSNASGKSTYLRMLGINIIFAQTLGIAFSAYFRAPFVRIYSSMTITDDIACGDSFYLAEIKRIKTIIDASKAGGRLLVLIDEILRGTNTTERVAASAEILRYLAANKALVVAATHDIELTDRLSDIYENYYFTEDINNIENEGEIFDYRIYRGVSYNRNAIRLLERYGYPEEIIKNSCEWIEHAAAGSEQIRGRH